MEIAGLKGGKLYAGSWMKLSLIPGAQANHARLSGARRRIDLLEGCSGGSTSPGMQTGKVVQHHRHQGVIAI